MSKDTDTIIIGAGLSGLAVAHKLRTSSYGHRFKLLEKTSGTGGVIRSFAENGFIAENGPHGFLDNCRESRELLEECGLHLECIKSPLINFVRYVLRSFPGGPSFVYLLSCGKSLCPANPRWQNG